MQSIKEICPKKKVPKAEIDLIVGEHVIPFLFMFIDKNDRRRET